MRAAWEEIRERSLVPLIQRDSIAVLVAAQALAQVRAGDAEIAGELRNLLADLYVPVPLEALPNGPPN